MTEERDTIPMSPGRRGENSVLRRDIDSVSEPSEEVTGIDYECIGNRVDLGTQC